MRSISIRAVTSVHVLHPGYIRDGGSRVGSSVSLVRDGDALIVVDPGLVANRGLILDPLGALGVRPEDVTHIFLSHHHPDHTVNIALFPNVEIVDFWARYIDDQWLDHDGDGYRLAPRSQMWLTPGHTDQDASLVVESDDGTYVFTHAWWGGDRTPAVDPYSPDQTVLDKSRARILEAADFVVPGHGEPFRVER